MAPQVSDPLIAAWRRGGLGAVVVLTALATGCVSTSGSLWSTSLLPAKKVPCQIVCTWQNSVAFVPDPTRGGTPGPGIAGRLYLFGPEVDFPLEAEGTLTVDLADETTGTPVLLERWIIDPETLARLRKKDMIGSGYTLFLPWSKYRPDITKIRLRSSFQGPPMPAPVYTENVVTLAQTNGLIREGAGPMSFPKGK